MIDIFRYKTILFDVGDTLLTRKPSNAEIFMERCINANISIKLTDAHNACKRCELWTGEQVMREQNGVPRMPDNEFSSYLDYIALQEIFKSKKSNDIWILVKKLKKFTAEKQEWDIIEGVNYTLEVLKNECIILGIVSNFNKTLPELLDRFELTKFFNNITISSFVNIEKPNPQILHIACERLNVKSNDCLYVGDHPFDVLCAKKANMDIAWICDENDVLPDYFGYKEDYRVSSVKALISG